MAGGYIKTFHFFGEKLYSLRLRFLLRFFAAYLGLGWVAGAAA